MVTRIGHVAIRARDIEKTAAFYRDVLGMSEAFRMQNAEGTALGSVHIYIAPSQFIEIFPDGEASTDTNKQKAGLHHLCIEVPDAASALAEIRARGAPIDTELKKGYSKCIQFWTHDPDGNAIEFVELPPDCQQVAANERLAGK